MLPTPTSTPFSLGMVRAHRRAMGRECRKEQNMLVLRRKIEEEIVIGADIHVKVLDIEGVRVKLGIVAPPDVPILREELLAREECSSQERSTEGHAVE